MFRLILKKHFLLVSFYMEEFVDQQFIKRLNYTIDYKVTSGLLPDICGSYNHNVTQDATSRFLSRLHLKTSAQKFSYRSETDNLWPVNIPRFRIF